MVVTSHDNIAKQGFGFDRCSVSAVITFPDQPDGETSGEGVVQSKELTVRAARDLAVFSADDPHFDAMMGQAGDTPVCVISLDPKHPNAAKHIASDGMAIVLETIKGNHSLAHWQGGRLWATYTWQAFPALEGSDSIEQQLSACFACGLAIGLGVDLTDAS